MFLENELSRVVSLDGEWQFKLGDTPRRSIHVPSAWEASQKDKINEGPTMYRRRFTMPIDETGARAGARPAPTRVVFEADAISFAATVRINGHRAGEHTGMWSPFQLDITPLVHESENEIEIEVWKPGEKRYKLRESLAGFLPDVCNTFGGIWQSVRIRQFADVAFSDLKIVTSRQGAVIVTGRVVLVDANGCLSLESLRGAITIEIQDFASLQTESFVIQDDGSFAAQLHVRSAQPWTLVRNPALFRIVIEVLVVGDDEPLARVSHRIGFRDIAAHESTTLLNGGPIHFRGVLDWGWDEKRLCPTPSREELLDHFAKARSLGFNLWKLCLFVPDETFFDVADEDGMLLWLELPMWLPKVTPTFRELALREYRDILKRVHHHPSIAIVSLGCELNAEADDGFIDELRTIAREWLPNVLLCDNSGSGEAYGGPVGSKSDFYDYHFYAEPHYFQPLVQHFSRSYQPDKPWIFGEFCDADTLRDFTKLDPKPFWLTDPITMKRDELTWGREYETRLHAAGVTDGGVVLMRMARRQATALRKFILEQTRLNSATGGYVVTGWMDAPIATSGVVDDRCELKFDPDEWQQFNADRVLVLDRERRRKWTYGSDRPVYRDPYSWWCDEPIELHIVLSNGSGVVESARLYWELTPDASASALFGVRAGEIGLTGLASGAVQEIGVLHLRALNPHAVHTLCRLHLSARLECDGEVVAANVWPLWILPRLDIETLRSSPELVEDLDPSLLDEVGDGRSRLLWVKRPDTFTVGLPFWRESVHVFGGLLSLIELSPSASAYTNPAFLGVASDMAIDKSKLAERLDIPEDWIQPLWRRFDARAMTWSDYIVNVKLGAGRFLVSTLRFAGGLGHQPASLETNPMGAWLLSCLLRSLDPK